MAYRDEYDLNVVGLRYSSVYGRAARLIALTCTMIAEDAMAGRATTCRLGSGRVLALRLCRRHRRCDGRRPRRTEDAAIRLQCGRT